MALALATDEHWNRAVGNDLRRYAAEQKASETAPPVRRHHDQVAAVLDRSLQDPFARILILVVYGDAVDAGLARELLTPDRMLVALSLAAFS